MIDTVNQGHDSFYLYQNTIMVRVNLKTLKNIFALLMKEFHGFLCIFVSKAVMSSIHVFTMTLYTVKLRGISSKEFE